MFNVSPLAILSILCLAAILLILCFHSIRKTREELQVVAERWRSTDQLLGWELQIKPMVIADLGCGSLLPTVDIDDLSVGPAFFRECRGKRRWAGLISDVPVILARYEWCVFFAMEMMDRESRELSSHFYWMRRSVRPAEWMAWSDARGHKWKRAGNDWWTVNSVDTAYCDGLFDLLCEHDCLAYVAEVFIDDNWLWCCGFPGEYAGDTIAAVESIASHVMTKRW